MMKTISFAFCPLCKKQKLVLIQKTEHLKPLRPNQPLEQYVVACGKGHLFKVVKDEMKGLWQHLLKN